MRLFKKVTAAVAMAAVCFSMVAPVSASAAPIVSLGHVYVHVDEEYTVEDVYSRQFTYMSDVDDDGYEEVVVDVCTEITYKYSYRLTCKKCGLGNYDYFEIILPPTHSESKCPMSSVG